MVVEFLFLSNLCIDYTRLDIEFLPTKKLGYAVQKWLKTVIFGMNSNFCGTNFNCITPGWD